MDLRKAVKLDVDKMAVAIANFRVELLALKGIISHADLDQAKEEFAGYMEAGWPIWLVEDGNRDVLGYVVAKVESGVIWAESLYVSSTSRRQGIASALYQQLELLANDLEEDTVYNWIHPNNDKMIQFLAKRGYDVLNLIEVRKQRKQETVSQSMEVGNHTYRY